MRLFIVAVSVALLLTAAHWATMRVRMSPAATAVLFFITALALLCALYACGHNWFIGQHGEAVRKWYNLLWANGVA